MERTDDILEAIFEIVRRIPKGRVTSYGAIAAAIGLRSGGRMIGHALRDASRTRKMPAHRVVNSSGLLTGKHHFKTLTQMQELLEKEGVAVKNDKVVHFREIFWDPMEEL